MIEFALIMPVLFIIVFIIVDAAIALDRWVVMTNAAREAARTGIVGADAAAITDRAIGTSHGLLADPDATVDVWWTDPNTNGHGDPGESVVVNVEYCYDLLTPISRLLPDRDGCPAGSLRMSACADMRLEQGVSGITTGGGCP
ncbi:MAG: pilus assembly protein [Dehalococcoidia bacterium]|nr:pilus assembly protein [Dehalococcoidia bacterium]